MIIAFGCQKNQGKDTAANLLHQLLPLKKISFASALKAQCYTLFKNYGLKDESYYETHYHDKEVLLPLLNKTPRQIWIDYATSVRAIHPNVWIDLALQENVIITDLRFKNEYDAIKAKNGITVKIVRSTEVESLDVDWDYIINNDGTLEDLNEKIIKLYQWLKNAHSCVC